MASITIEDIPEDLRAQLTKEAEANFRSLSQEALARLQRSLELDALLNTGGVQKWIDEAIASGPEEQFNREKFAAALRHGLERAGSKAA